MAISYQQKKRQPWLAKKSGYQQSQTEKQYIISGRTNKVFIPLLWVFFWYLIWGGHFHKLITFSDRNRLLLYCWLEIHATNFGVALVVRNKVFFRSRYFCCFFGAWNSNILEAAKISVHFYRRIKFTFFENMLQIMCLVLISRMIEAFAGSSTVCSVTGTQLYLDFLRHKVWNPVKTSSSRRLGYIRSYNIFTLKYGKHHWTSC